MRYQQAETANGAPLHLCSICYHYWGDMHCFSGRCTGGPTGCPKCDPWAWDEDKDGRIWWSYAPEHAEPESLIDGDYRPGVW